MTPTKPYTIGVAGGSGSGKTTVVEKILQRVGAANALVVQHDWYYKHRSDLSFEKRCELNYDHPDALETSLLIRHLQQLLAGEQTTVPRYDFTRHLRQKETTTLQPHPIIIVDGILIFWEKALRSLMDLKVFVDTDSDSRFIRRMERDIKERKRTRESVVAQYLETVKPMHDLFVEPTKRHADVIVPRGGRNTLAINLLIAHIKSILKP